LPARNLVGTLGHLMTTNRPAIETYLMDMDGVLVHEERLIPGAARARSSLAIAVSWCMAGPPLATDGRLPASLQGPAGGPGRPPAQG
jgi:hypothetical protein